jgi:hypothetical protein
MNAFKLLTCIAFLSSITVFGDEIIVRTPSGESLVIEVEGEQTFSDVIQHIESQVNTIDPQESPRSFQWFIDFMNPSEPSAAVNSNATPRDYYKPVTQSERRDIDYVVRTLSTASWTSLLGAKSSLETAGDHIDNLHPLRFLSILFSDSKLKSGVHAIRDRKKIWKEFSSGIIDSLEQENKANNIKAEYVDDFAKLVKIDPAIIRGPIQNKQWDDLLELLIARIPRDGDTGRYDM